MTYDIIIIGSGPAGLTAALYASRAGLKTLAIAGTVSGGQLMLTTTVENYPGFPEGIQGPELMEKMRRQAERFGTEFVDDNATEVELNKRPFAVQIGETSYQARALIVATGASAKWLGLESEKRLIGRGVSSCATCDGFFFKDKEVIVVGGGDTAMEETLFLSKICSEVTVVHRRDSLRASKIMQDRARANPKIHWEWNSTVVEILGTEKVEGVRLRDVKTGAERTLPCQAVFVAIGHKPETDLFRGKLEMNEVGYLELRNDTETSVEGVFAAGDVHDFRYRQAVTAAASGCKAALDAEKYLQRIGY